MNENTTTEDPTRVKLALKAADIITGDRQTDYGPPEVNFQRIANLWNDHMETTMFTPRKVAELMLLLKIARTVNSPTEDSYVDLIGYAALAGEMAENEKKKKPYLKEGNVVINVIPSSTTEEVGKTAERLFANMNTSI